MIPSVTEAQRYKNRISHIKNNLDEITLRRAEYWVNTLIVDEITERMRSANFSQKIWMNTKIILSAIERNKIVITIQNYYFSESGFDVAIAREYGTKDHWIRPRFKQLLSWIKEGKRLFSKGHVVSGIKSLHIIRDVVKERMPEVQRMLTKDIDDWKNSVFNS